MVAIEFHTLKVGGSIPPLATKTANSIPIKQNKMKMYAVIMWEKYYIIQEVEVNI